MITCSGCDSTWSGLGRAHCSSCHETFGSVSGFDRHRRAGMCIAPDACGLSQTNGGPWVGQGGYWGSNASEAVTAGSES